MPIHALPVLPILHKQEVSFIISYSAIVAVTKTHLTQILALLVIRGTLLPCITSEIH